MKKYKVLTQFMPDVIVGQEVAEGTSFYSIACTNNKNDFSKYYVENHPEIFQEIIDNQWHPVSGEVFYYIDFVDQALHVGEVIRASSMGNLGKNDLNVFKTKHQAERARKKIVDILKEFHEDIQKEKTV